MYNFFRKDLLMFGKRNLLFLFGYMILAMIVFQSMTSMGLYKIIIVSVVYTIASGSFGSEEKNNFKYIVNSLPVNRRNIVISKYLSVLIYSLIVTFIMSIVGLVLMIFKVYTGMDFINISTAVQSILIVLFMSSITFPAYFKFEYKQAHIINFVIYFGVFIGIFNLYSRDGGEFISKIQLFIINNEALLNVICPIIVVVMVFLSAILSISLYKNKDL